MIWRGEPIEPIVPDTIFIKCPTCNGTGHLSPERARELADRYREPICLAYGCETCKGLGEVETPPQTGGGE